jgi:alpha 1,3-glucosidase
MVNNGFEDLNVPMDTLWMDIMHTDDARFMKWNKRNFPSPLKLSEELRASGRHLVAVVDPHVKVDDEYFLYKGAKDQGLLIRNPDNEVFEGYCSIESGIC